jgi:hypothetical protein
MAALLEKVDLYKAHANEYATPKTPAFVDVGPAQYLAISGKGEPGGEAFTAAVGALYNVAFTVKMARKFAGSDYAVSKLEGLWWSNKDGVAFMQIPRNLWRWQLMIRTPEFISSTDVADAIDKLIGRGKPRLVAKVALEELSEGECVQMLHVGPYSDEPQSIATMRAFATEHGRDFSGRHHEIYLSDPRRVDPKKLRTILRQPVRRARRRGPGGGD